MRPISDKNLWILLLIVLFKFVDGTSPAQTPTPPPHHQPPTAIAPSTAAAHNTLQLPWLPTMDEFAFQSAQQQKHRQSQSDTVARAGQREEITTELPGDNKHTDTTQAFAMSKVSVRKPEMHKIRNEMQQMNKDNDKNNTRQNAHNKADHHDDDGDDAAAVDDVNKANLQGVKELKPLASLQAGEFVISSSNRNNMGSQSRATAIDTLAIGKASTALKTLATPYSSKYKEEKTLEFLVPSSDRRQRRSSEQADQTKSLANLKADYTEIMSGSVDRAESQTTASTPTLTISGQSKSRNTTATLSSSTTLTPTQSPTQLKRADEQEKSAQGPNQQAHNNAHESAPRRGSNATARGQQQAAAAPAIAKKPTHLTVTLPLEIETALQNPLTSVIIIDGVAEVLAGVEHDSGASASATLSADNEVALAAPPHPLRPHVESVDYMNDESPASNSMEMLGEEMTVVYAEQHSAVHLPCEVDFPIVSSMWYKNGQVIHAMDRNARVTDYRFVNEPNGALTISNVMLEDEGKWQCEAENAHRYTENGRAVKLVVLDRPKPPYLLIDSRRLDASNIFVPVKENTELNVACISEGGNPKPTLTWEVLLSPGVDRHSQKLSAEVLELEEIKSEKNKVDSVKSEARLSAVYRAHHNARILCVMEHPTLKIRQNASLLLDVQYTPSFAISRTPGFGYPLREGIEVSLKCDVDSNPMSTPRWQKDDGETPVPQSSDGFLNFTSIRREHSGWYKCTSRHLNFQYSSIGYYLSVRYDSVDSTSESYDPESALVDTLHNPNKEQLEVKLGGAVTLQCPQGSLGCWSHLDPATARLRGLGHGLTTPTGQFALKDVVYQDAGTYKCIGQSPTNKKKLEILHTVGILVRGAPTVIARDASPVAYPGSPLHLSVEFCANPSAHAARWLHGERVYTPGNQYGSAVLAYGVTDLPTPYCKQARLTYVSMHERVPRTFYFIVSSVAGAAEAVFKVNFTMRYQPMNPNSNEIDEEELTQPEEIHFPIFGSAMPVMAIARFQSILVVIGLAIFAIIRREMTVLANVR